MHRGFIYVSGPEAQPFLQSLVTCSISPDETRYGFLLTPNGRFLFDLFVTPYQEGYLVDAFNPDELFQKLNRYKLRREVTVQTLVEKVAWSLEKPVGFCFPDVRFEGFRFMADHYDDALYQMHRIMQGVSDPLSELIPEKSIILEHKLPETAIDYKKGCYIGQELIARTHYTGQLRKRMLPFKIIEGHVNTGDNLCDGELVVYSKADPYILAMTRDSLWEMPRITWGDVILELYS